MSFLCDDCKIKIAGRFWNNVDKSDPDGCWAFGTGLGYGSFKLRSYKAAVPSRVAYMLEVGPIPIGLDVCHRCDNPPCVRPSHLFVGTRRDNMQDCKAKGRATVGAKNGNAALDNETVRLIRNSYVAGYYSSQQFLAEHFGVSQSTISRIVKGEVYADS